MPYAAYRLDAASSELLKVIRPTEPALSENEDDDKIGSLSGSPSPTRRRPASSSSLLSAISNLFSIDLNLSY